MLFLQALLNTDCRVSRVCKDRSFYITHTGRGDNYYNNKKISISNYITINNVSSLLPIVHKSKQVGMYIYYYFNII